jgi:hypothetical protein
MTDPLESHLLRQVTHRRTSFWHEIRARAVLDHVPVDRPTTVADIGAGAGLLGDILRRDRPLADYRFYEPLESAATLVGARHGPEAQMSSSAELDGADVITLLDVVEHIDDDRAFVTELVSHAPAGAIVVVTVPALPSLWSTWDEQLGHYRRHTKQSLTQLFAGLPVATVEVSYLFPELLPPAIVRRAARSRTGAPPASDFPQLPRALDALLLRVGRLTYRWRERWPGGTSVLYVGRVYSWPE